MKNFLKRKNGETLIEVVIAVSILTLISSTASGLFINSIHHTAANYHDLIAGNLAEDGIEMINRMHYNNFLRFSSKASLCWNTKPEHADLADCDDAGNKILAGSHRLALDADSLHWTLERLGDDLLPVDVLPASDSSYRLKLDEIPEACPVGVSPDPAVCGPHKHFMNDTHLYNHARGSDANFYREIFIEYDASAELLEATSAVFFNVGTKVRRISRTATLTSTLQ